ncbi:MAG TPA: glycosyltransferase [Planctomycetota bacterium]|nr:glycosyltransferase [Planctomycetota bacterium]
MSDVSVVICAQNARERLRSCLESLKQALPWSSEVLVVDSGSTDGTQRMVTDAYEHVRLVRNETDPGFANAANQGVAMSRGAYVLLLDARIQLYPGAVTEMVAYLERNLRHGAVVPRLLRADGSTVAAHLRLPTLATALWLGTPLERWRPRNAELSRAFACDFDYERDGDVEHTASACFLMRRKALKRSYTLDASLWPHFHEADLCARVREAGWRIGYASSVLALDEDGVGEQVYPELSPEWHAQRLAWYRTHLGQGAGWWVKSCVGWTLADRLARELRRRINGIREEPILPVWRAYSGVLRG